MTVNDRQENLVHRDVSFGGFQVTSGTGVQQGVGVFVDSVRVNEPAVEEVNFDLTPLEAIDRIELSRGRSGIFEQHERRGGGAKTGEQTAVDL